MSQPQRTKLTDEYVYRVAPDGKSALAGLQLVQQGAFSRALASAAGPRFEAECRGSGPVPYRVVVDLSDPERPQLGCDCSSYKRPCKHALGLLFLVVRRPELFDDGRSDRAVDGLAVAVVRPDASAAAPPVHTGEVLLQDILTNREDMTPRLVYADWLEEHGEPAGRDRAEFIRVQMELENAASARVPGSCGPGSVPSGSNTAQPGYRSRRRDTQRSRRSDVAFTRNCVCRWRRGRGTSARSWRTTRSPAFASPPASTGTGRGTSQWSPN